jgi:hypothetical protein
MQNARIIRVVSRNRLIVVIEPHESVLEIYLEEPLSKTVFDHAISVLTPYNPATARVLIGHYQNARFEGCRLEGLAFPPPPLRLKPDYSKRARGSARS